MKLIIIRKTIRFSVDSRTRNHKAAQSNAVFNAYTIYGTGTTNFISLVRSMR